jgi:hypothetical protein
MNVVISIGKWLLPYVLKMADKYVPELLEALVHRIKEKKEVKIMSTKITFHVKALGRNDGIAGAHITYHIDGIGDNHADTDGTGTASITSLPVGAYTFKVSAAGFEPATTTVNLQDGIDKDVPIILTVSQTVQNAVQDAETKVANAATPVIEKVVEAGVAISTTNCETLADAKTAYKALVASVDASKDNIQAAIKTGATEIVQAEGAKLTKTLKEQLSDSIHWYVKKRSELGSEKEIMHDWSKFKAWCDYTSMIAGMAFLRTSLMTFVDGIATWAIDHM